MTDTKTTAEKITEVFYGRVGWTNLTMEQMEAQVVGVLADHDAMLAAAVREQCKKILPAGTDNDLLREAMDALPLPNADTSQLSASRRDEGIRLEARLNEVQQMRAVFMQPKTRIKHVLATLTERIAELEAALEER